MWHTGKVTYTYCNNNIFVVSGNKALYVKLKINDENEIDTEAIMSSTAYVLSPISLAKD